MKLKSACKTPCKGCPFAKRGESGELGGSPVETYVGQAHLAMWLPCHSEREYAGKRSVDNMDEIAQCSGAARLRKKLQEKWGIDYMALEVQDDPDGKAFDTIEEFVMHHTGETIGEMDADVISLYMKLELDKVAANAGRCVRRVEA